jgi:uncharacterized protein (UPF0548 family)
VFLLRRPSEEQIRNLLIAEQNAPLSYPEVGATRDTPPPRYTIDHNRVRLGKGQATFEGAVAALRRWEMFGVGWMELCWPDAPIAVGSIVGILAPGFGLWTLNACRIVYTVEEDGPIQRYGFAYGTLPDHVGRGEERFTVEWRRDDDSIWYDILAFSRPNQLLVRVGYPAMRMLQRRFARDSKAAMVRAVGG